MATHPDRLPAEFILTSDPVEQKAIVEDIAGRIDSGVLKLSTVFRDLQPFLGEDDAPLPDIAQALSFLSEVLETSKLPIPRTDLHQYVVYLASRIENDDQIHNYRAGITQIAKCLNIIILMPSFSGNDAALIIRAIFKFNTGNNLKDSPVSTRLALLKLLQELMSRHPSNIKKDMHPFNDFVVGMVGMGERELDPNCLNVLWPIYKDLGDSQVWDISPHALKIIFDSFFRYFPITVGKKVGAQVSPDNLRLLLLDCFLSNDQYADYAFPELIEKLDTSTGESLSANVKTDIFVTMKACVSGYSVPKVQAWAEKIWGSLKFEIWNGENEEFIAGALEVIHLLVRALFLEYLGDLPEEAVIKTSTEIVGSILKECRDRLVNSRQTYMISTGRILYAIGSASSISWVPVSMVILPAIFTLWQDLNLKSEKTIFLGALNRILQAGLDVGRNLEKDLIDCRGQLVDVYFDAMVDEVSDSPDGNAFQTISIEGLVLLMRGQNLLSDFEKGTIIEKINALLLQPNRDESLNEAAVTALRTISMTDPERFSSITMPNLALNLPESLSKHQNLREQGLDRVIDKLESLTQITCTVAWDVKDPKVDPSKLVFTVYQKWLVSKTAKLIKQQNQLEYANVLLVAIYKGLEEFETAIEKAKVTFGSLFDSSTHPYFWIIQNLLKEIIRVKDVDGNPYIGLDFAADQNQQVNDKFIGLVGNIITLVLRSKETTDKNNPVDSRGAVPSQVWALFCTDAPPSLDLSQQSLIKGPSDKCLANILSMSIVAGQPKEARLNINVGSVALAMIDNATSSDCSCSVYSRTSMLYFLQLLVNKFKAAHAIVNGKTVLNTFDDYLQLAVASDNKLKVTHVYQTLTYFTTAALACGDSSTKTLLDHMILAISHPTLGQKVAQSFRILLAPSAIITKENFCYVRPLRQGRLFQYGVKEMISAYRTTSKELQHYLKARYLVAIAGCLHYMEPQVYLDDIKDLFPLILEGTTVSDDAFTKLTCISIIKTLIPNDPALIEQYLESVINRMTDRIRNTYHSPSDSNASTRAAALEVLILLVNYVEKAVLAKKKPYIMKELEWAVDDVSAEVRAVAYRCRLAYVNLVA